MYNTYLYTHTCIYKPFFSDQIHVSERCATLKSISVLLFMCACAHQHTRTHTCPCVTADVWMSGYSSRSCLSPTLDPGIESRPSGSQSKIFAHRTLSQAHDVFFNVYKTYKANSLMQYRAATKGVHVLRPYLNQSPHITCLSIVQALRKGLL